MHSFKLYRIAPEIVRCFATVAAVATIMATEDIPLSNGVPGSCRHDVYGGGGGTFIHQRSCSLILLCNNEMKAKLYVENAGLAIIEQRTMTELVEPKIGVWMFPKSLRVRRGGKCGMLEFVRSFAKD
jgi:hypothetical protein